MLRELPPHIGYCYREAIACRDAARRSRFPESRVAFEALEQSWLQLARQYEFVERLDQFKRANDALDQQQAVQSQASDVRQRFRVIEGGRN